MDKENRVITNVDLVDIDFNVGDLNTLLRTPDEGLEIYSAMKVPDFDYYSHVDEIRNMYRCIDLSDDVCNIHLRT